MNKTPFAELELFVQGEATAGTVEPHFPSYFANDRLGPAFAINTSDYETDESSSGPDSDEDETFVVSTDTQLEDDGDVTYMEEMLEAAASNGLAANFAKLAARALALKHDRDVASVHPESIQEPDGEREGGGEDGAHIAAGGTFPHVLSLLLSLITAVIARYAHCLPLPDSVEEGVEAAVATVMAFGSTHMGDCSATNNADRRFPQDLARLVAALGQVGLVGICEQVLVSLTATAADFTCGEFLDLAQDWRLWTTCTETVGQRLAYWIFDGIRNQTWRRRTDISPGNALTDDEGDQWGIIEDRTGCSPSLQALATGAPGIVRGADEVCLVVERDLYVARFACLQVRFPVNYYLSVPILVRTNLIGWWIAAGQWHRLNSEGLFVRG